MLPIQETLPPCSVVARNYAEHSPNKVHDPATARALGYEGALVPGVAMFAYLVAPVMAVHGNAWLSGGRLAGRFQKPLYPGVEATASGRRRADGTGYDLGLHTNDGISRAVGEAQWLGDSARSAMPTRAAGPSRRCRAIATYTERS